MRVFAVFVIVALIVGGAIGYLYLQRQHQTALAMEREAAEQKTVGARDAGLQVSRQLAEDVGRVVAVAIAGDVAKGDSAGLEGKLAAMVHGNRVMTILVLDSSGRALVATDRRFEGRLMDDAESRRALAVTELTLFTETTLPTQVEVAVPLVVESDRVGTLRVMVDLGPFAVDRSLVSEG